MYEYLSIWWIEEKFLIVNNLTVSQGSSVTVTNDLPPKEGL